MTRSQPLRCQPLFEGERPAANPDARLVVGARVCFVPGQPTALHGHPVATVEMLGGGPETSARHDRRSKR